MRQRTSISNWTTWQWVSSSNWTTHDRTSNSNWMIRLGYSSSNWKTLTFVVPQSLTMADPNQIIPNWIILDPTSILTNHVRVHATHDRKHGYHDSFTLCNGCTHFPWGVISSSVSRWLTSPFCHAYQAYSHFLWCEARISLQGILMASSSL
jgi:hypothetical protein